MARFAGAVGFAEQVNTAPGVYRDEIVERQYTGTVIRNAVRWNTGSEVNEPMRLDQSISIILDPYFNDHLQALRYVRWMGGLWKITSVQIQRPRVILQLGSEYHEQTP